MVSELSPAGAVGNESPLLARKRVVDPSGYTDWDRTERIGEPPSDGCLGYAKV